MPSKSRSVSTGSGLSRAVSTGDGGGFLKATRRSRFRRALLYASRRAAKPRRVSYCHRFDGSSDTPSSMGAKRAADGCAGQHFERGSLGTGGVPLACSKIDFPPVEPDG